MPPLWQSHDGPPSMPRRRGRNLGAGFAMTGHASPWLHLTPHDYILAPKKCNAQATERFHCLFYPLIHKFTCAYTETCLRIRVAYTEPPSLGIRVRIRSHVLKKYCKKLWNSLGAIVFWLTKPNFGPLVLKKKRSGLNVLITKIVLCMKRHSLTRSLRGTPVLGKAGWRQKVTPENWRQHCFLSAKDRRVTSKLLNVILHYRQPFLKLSGI